VCLSELQRLLDSGSALRLDRPCTYGKPPLSIFDRVKPEATPSLQSSDKPRNPAMVAARVLAA